MAVLWQTGAFCYMFAGITMMSWHRACLPRSGDQHLLLEGEAEVLHTAVGNAEANDTRGVLISRDSAYYLIHSCEKQRNLELGRRVRDLIVHSGLDSISILCDPILRLFCYHGCLFEANEVYNKIDKPSSYAWAAFVLANFKLDMAFELYYSVQLSSSKNPRHIFVAIIKACVMSNLQFLARIVHSQIIEYGLQSDTFVGNTLIDMYVKCGHFQKARELFDTLQNRDVVSWNAIIAGYSQDMGCVVALECFGKMQEESMQPNSITFLSLLKACSTGTIEQCRCIYEKIIACRVPLDDAMGSALVDAYSKCGYLEEAHVVFDKLINKDVVSWNALIAGHACHSDYPSSLICFARMQEEGIKPDDVTFSIVLKTCAIESQIEQGRLIHGQIIARKFQPDLVLGNSLIDMYGKCGNLEEAYKSFSTLLNRDVVSWGSMISGYAQHGEGRLALDLFEKMKQEGIVPNVVIFLSVLKACCHLGAVGMGRLIHDMTIKQGIHLNDVLGNALIDMYAKCGSLNEALKVFDNLPEQDVISWGAIGAGYAHHGQSAPVVEWLGKMQHDGLNADRISFTSILIVCSRAGLVEEGLWYFRCMRDYHAIEPDILHLICTIDLLSRARCLKEAKDLLQASIKSDLQGWVALLSACKMYENIEIARCCFDQILLLDSRCIAGYVLMSNIYAEANMQEDACKIKELKVQNVVCSRKQV